MLRYSHKSQKAISGIPNGTDLEPTRKGQLLVRLSEADEAVLATRISTGSDPEADSMSAWTGVIPYE
jgi:hypothetical protein